MVGAVFSTSPLLLHEAITSFFKMLKYEHIQTPGDAYEAYREAHKNLNRTRHELAEQVGPRFNGPSLSRYARQLDEAGREKFRPLAKQMLDILLKMLARKYSTRYEDDPWADVGQLFEIEKLLDALLKVRHKFTRSKSHLVSAQMADPAANRDRA